MTCRIPVVSIAILVWIAGCAGLPLAEMPASPIAVRYLDPEQERRVRERQLEQRELARRGGAGGEDLRLGHADARDVARYFQRTVGGGRGGGGTGNRREPDEHSARIALVDPRTGEFEVLAEARPGAMPVAWSADRRRLMFSQLRRGYPQLFEIDLSNREVRPLTHEPGAHPWGCYGPDGRIVVETQHFTERGYRTQIEISTPGGGRFSPLTAGPADSRPTCAPDGSAIAYVSDSRFAAGPDAGHSRPVAGSGLQVVVRTPVTDGEPDVVGPGIDPSFTPDSKQIIYSAPQRISGERGVETRWRLRRARVSGLGRGGFATGPLDEVEPTVSPDGRIIAFVGIDSELHSTLFVRRIDGSAERILFSHGAALGPIW